MRASWLLGGVAVIALAGCSPRHSGVYVAHDGRNVAMIQLVENQDGELTGRLEQVSLDDTGAATSRSIPLDGEVDGRQAIFRAKGLLASASLTGQFDSRGLILSTNGSSQNFSRTDVAAFEHEVKELKARGRDVAEAKQVREANAALSKSAAMLADINRATPELVRRVGLIRQHFEEVNGALRQSDQAADDLSRVGRDVAAGQGYARSGALLAERARTQSLFVGLRQAVNNKLGESTSLTAKVRILCGEATKVRHGELCKALDDHDARLRGIVSTLKPEFEAAARANGG